MRYALFFIALVLVPEIGYGMDLRSLEEGTARNFTQELSHLREMGLIEEGENDITRQIEQLTDEQRARLSSGQTRCGRSGGGFFAGLFGGPSSSHHEQESLFLLRDLHRIALEEQRASQARTEELEKLSRRFKIILIVVGTGLLGSLGANGGFLSNLISGGADAASNV